MKIKEEYMNYPPESNRSRDAANFFRDVIKRNNPIQGKILLFNACVMNIKRNVRIKCPNRNMHRLRAYFFRYIMHKKIDFIKISTVVKLLPQI